MKLTHSEKAVLLEALEGYGIDKHHYYDEDGDEIDIDTERTITNVGELTDRQNLINRIQKIKSEAPAI